MEKFETIELPIVVRECEDGRYMGYINHKHLKGVMSVGNTVEELKSNMNDAFNVMMEFMNSDVYRK